MNMTLLSPPLRVGRRFALPALIAVSFLLLALVPASAPAAADMEIAVQDDAVLVGRLYYDRDRALDQIRDMGATRSGGERRVMSIESATTRDHL